MSRTLGLTFVLLLALAGTQYFLSHQDALDSVAKDQAGSIVDCENLAAGDRDSGGRKTHTTTMSNPNG